jgi:hypothetical protein
VRLVVLLICVLVLFRPLPACAYVGPGLGLGALGAILGILLSIFLAIFGIFWYPIKRLIKKIRKMTRKEPPPKDVSP